MPSRAIDRLSLEELFTHAENVRMLLNHPGWTFLQSLMDAEATELSRFMDGDRDISHVEYARKHGRIGGLLASTRIANDLLDHAAKRYAEQQAKHEGSRESEPVRS